MADALLSTVARCDGSEIRIYQKTSENGRPYFELGVWASPQEGGHKIRYLALRRYEVRGVLLGLLEACKAVNLPLRREDAKEVEQLTQEPTPYNPPIKKRGRPKSPW